MGRKMWDTFPAELMPSPYRSIRSLQKGKGQLPADIMFAINIRISPHSGALTLHEPFIKLKI